YSLMRLDPTPPLFPYTTLFRSPSGAGRAGARLFPVPLPAVPWKRWKHPPDPGRDSGGGGGICRKRDSSAGKERRIPLSGNRAGLDRKSTRLNSSHVSISYAVFC